MKKKTCLLFFSAAMLLSGCLVGCNKEPTASYYDLTKESTYGKIGGYSKKTVNEGDTLTFTVTPNQYFFIDQVTNNNEPCTRIRRNPDGSAVYSAYMKAGVNKLKATYKVDSMIDFVDQFKLDISDEVFNAVIGANDVGNITGIDFRRCGIEKMKAPFAWNGNNKIPTDNFLNYVDGDTTHIETANLGYTIKIRYLNINTPESTDQIEEWGLSASNYNKYVYTGDTSYLTDIVGNGIYNEDLSQNPCAPTTIILMGQDFAKNSSKVTKADLKIGTRETGTYPSSQDGNQRDLAYVWYSTVKNPTKNDFRCLNLEMVYQGFSIGTGSLEDTNAYIYHMFDCANLNATANRRHLFSGVHDLNYHYWKEQPVEDLTLEELYASAPDDADIGKYPESKYADKKTLYRVHGYVSRKVGTSWYMQSKLSYTPEEVAQGKAVGIYVFTFALNPVSVGDEVSIIGDITTYSGNFQMAGVMFNDIKHNPKRHSKVISSGNKVIPYKLTGEEFNTLHLPNVLVEIVDSVYFYDFHSTYDGEKKPIGEQGIREIDAYNEYYPFYCVNNTPIWYGSYGETDNAQAIEDNTSGKSTGARYDNRVIRFVLDQNVIINYSAEESKSYRFFTGGEYVYNCNGPEFANYDESNPYKNDTERYVHVRKGVNYAYGDDGASGMVVISAAYENSAKTHRRMTAKVVSARDVPLVELK